ncbi:PEP-CTERM sorting domain-containing protein [Desulfopila sp. IMCC35006]|uniref:PEP-CTERM sorting domain-containing protein n=1 Tax=Desulfopila sp. IMCC35006 TaxID=2569542 RepID=UPI0010AD99DC|nr:PEP-CTERM sorting domain-containing protein [Desulfopila sp. IMCC35006]TKB23945.1 PEP-CTERM sorting domain-containing protein [Desulfopila sp. IMCC35006]
MRKEAYGFLIGLFGLFFSYGIVYAYPVQYTIEGQVIQGPGINDSAGYLSQLGIAVGSSVSYTIDIDLAAPATQVLSDRTTIPLLPSSTQDQFYYAHLVAGTTVTTDIWQDSHDGVAEYNLIADEGLVTHDLYMLAATGNNSLQFVGLSFDPNSWVVGSNFRSGYMRSFTYDESGNSSSFNFNGRITSIVPAPVPEPSTFLLLGASLLGAGLFRKIIRRKRLVDSV